MAKIFVERIIIKNRAPFENLDLTFKENETVVLTAVNGRGKTTILSYIVDAWHEMARPYFKNEFEGKENKYYRVSSPIFNMNQNTPSFVYIRFKTQEKQIDYVDIRNNCNQQQYDIAIPLDAKIPFSQLEASLKNAQNIKFVSNLDKDLAEKLFNNNTITYFPAYRYEIPGYLNDPYKVHLDFTKESSFVGYLPNPLEVVTGLPQFANWIMDVMLDYFQKQEPLRQVLSSVTKNTEGQVVLPQNIHYLLSDFLLLQNLNTIITQTLSSTKRNNCKYEFRIGDRSAGGTRISIKQIASDTQQSESLLYPTIFNLSSGEAAMLCLFGEILRQADKSRNNIALQQITGIVLIDEVDKHLHIKLQKEVLPVLFSLFPNIQFIISSHSPFLNIGFSENEKTKSRSTIIDLDQGGIRIPLLKNIIYQEVYQLMLNENENYAKLFQQLSLSQNKPILFVEDTYTQIYKVVYLKLKEIDFDEHNLEEVFDRNAEFCIYGKGNRNNLQGFLDNPCMNEWTQKTIVGLFDFDDAYDNYLNLKSKWEEISKDERNGLYKKRKDCNVYALMLPIPVFREDIAGENQKVRQLEVELLITDDKIKECYGDSDYATERITRDLVIPKIKNKGDFWKKSIVLDKVDFKYFQPLFATLDSIFNNNDI